MSEERGWHQRDLAGRKEGGGGGGSCLMGRGAESGVDDRDLVGNEPGHVVVDGVEGCPWLVQPQDELEAVASDRPQRGARHKRGRRGI